MGKASRDKGKRGEQELARLLRNMGAQITAARGAQHKGGPDSPDVVTGIRGIHLECKRTEKLSLYPALQQAKDEAPEGAVPVVAHRRNAQEWVAILNLGDFVSLLREAGRLQ